MSIQIVNKKIYRGPGEYIGRPTILGNPFTHIRLNTLAENIVSTREEAVEQYRLWLRHQYKNKTTAYDELMRLVNIYKKKQNLILVCWCAPQACHGDVVKSAILGMLSRENNGII